MKTIELSSWEEFQDELKKLQDLLEKKRSKDGHHVSKPLFRGQSDQRWLLESTLERFGIHDFPFHNYYQAMWRSKAQIETLTGKRWAIESMSEIEQFFESHETLMVPPYPGYDFMVYLRHHGFPSPLVDWSSSPFIASFFAFNSAKEKEENGRVAIFAFCEFFGSGKFGMRGSPEIQSLGPFVTSHPRHFRQQSAYTLCIAKSKEWHYTSHESAFMRNDLDQDLLWKFTIPTSERRKALEYLDLHNLNAYSLFDSEESLMSTMAIRELYLHLPSA